MTDATPNFSLVIPAFNEEANVAPVVAEVLRTLEANSWIGRSEVILVNDGSVDGTGAVMDRLAAAHAEVRVLHHPVNRGFGAALRTGFGASRGVNVALISADGEIGPDQAVNLLREMGDAELIVGYRKREVSFYRKFLTYGFNLLVRLLLGFVPDEVLIYVVHGDLLRRMDLRSDTGLVNLEVLLHCKEWGSRTKWSVASARPRLSGVSKVANLRTMVRILVEMFKLGRSIGARRADAGSVR